jgi:biopolymer transport protein ExbD
MVEKRRFLDVWLIESNTVYREVPFNVVTDWVQQSRLQPDDMLRPSGTKEWLRVGDSPEFTPYVPRPEPTRVEDQAEALEPVQVEFAWKRRRDEEDDDVDMIPLIDVSLVLLIFFMLSAAGAGTAAFIDTPSAERGLVSSSPNLVWVGIDLDGNNDPIFSIGQEDRPAEKADRNIHSISELLKRLDERLKEPVRLQVTIRAHKEVESGLVRDLTADLTRRRLPDPANGRKGIVDAKYITVSEGGS